jgi:hypothetical protein
MISGVGFAIAKIIGSFFIVFTISFVTTRGAETQTKTSAQTRAIDRFPDISSLFVISKISPFSLFKSSLFLEIIHLLSQTTISQTQYNLKSLIIAVHAAQSQFTTIFMSSLFFSTTFKELINQASATIAVQC